MSSRLPIAAGLATGVVAAVLLLGLVLVLVPPPDSGAATPRPVLPSAETAGPSAPASSSPSGSIPPSTPGSTAGRPSPGATGGPTAPGSTTAADNFHVGRPAPPLRVPQLGGGTIDLAALRGEPVWVNFMATWCPPCVDEFPLMNGFAARYGDEGLVVVAIDVREDESTVAAFVQSLEATFPIGLDTDGDAQQAWGAAALPVHYWVDAEGIVRDGALGGIGPDAMARGIEAILPGTEVTP